MWVPPLAPSSRFFRIHVIPSVQNHLASDHSLPLHPTVSDIHNIRHYWPSLESDPALGANPLVCRAESALGVALLK